MVRFPGGDGYDALVRAHEIAGEIESWFAERRSNELGVDGLQTLLVAGVSDDYAQVDGGTAALAQLPIRWTARLE
jgi:hypothetical protein